MKTRPTQISYHEWKIAGQAGRVRRLTDGFEFWMSKWDPFYWLMGPRGRKIVRDTQIRAISHWGRAIHIAFDQDDEIMLRDEILRDFDPSSVPFPVVREPNGGSNARRMKKMKLRQRALGPISWEHGRLGPGLTSSLSIQLRKSAFVVAVVATVLFLALNR